MNIALLPKQLEVLRSRAVLTIYLGGIGAGKTFVSAVWAACRALKGRTVLILEPTYAMARDVYLRTLEDVLERMGLKNMVHFQVNLSTLTVTFTGGKGCIMLRSADAVERIRGINCDDTAIDEMGSLKTDEPYRILVGRMRKSKDGQILLTGTPTAYGWVKALCENPGANVIRLSSLENHFLPVNYLNNLALVYGVGTAWYRQEVLGQFVEFSAGIVPTDQLRITDGPFPFGKYVCRAWDTASSTGTSGDYTATALLSMTEQGTVHIHDYDRKRGPYASVRPWITQTIAADGPGVEQVFENTQGGSIVAQDIAAVKAFAKFQITTVTPLRDKVSRALPLASRMSLGGVTISRRPLLKEYLDELRTFPKCEHDDLMDATAHAYNALATARERIVKPFQHQLF